MAIGHERDCNNHYNSRTAIPVIGLVFLGTLSLALLLMKVLWV